MSENNDLVNYLDKDELYKTQKDTLDANKEATAKLLKSHYDATVEALERNKSNQLQAANISNARLMKYLPEYQATMGLYGNGASESMLLDAAARHRSAQGAIFSEYNAGIAEALRAKNEQELLGQQNYDKALLGYYTDAKLRAEAKEANEKAKEEAKQNATYEAIRTGIANGLYESGALMNYMGQWNGTVNPEQHKDLVSLAQGAIVTDLRSRMNAYMGDMDSFSKDFGSYFTEEQNPKIGSGYNALKSAYETKLSEYQKRSADAVTKPSEVVKVRGVPGDLEKGNEIKVKIGDTVLYMELGDMINSATADGVQQPIYEAATAANVPDMGVFLYDGEAYFKNGDIICRLQKRKNDEEMDNGYRSLIGHIRGKE